MAEPNANIESDKTNTRETARGGQGAAAERRSFEDAAATTTRAAKTTSDAVAEGSRQMVEAGRQSGRYAADAWSRALDPFMSLQMDMNRWVDEFWRQATGLGAQSPLRTARPMGALGAASLFGLPPADLRETDKGYRLSVELPGLAKDEIDVSLRGDVLLIAGHKTEEAHEPGGAYRISERRFGRFERGFPIPDDIDRTAIEAEFKDGVLRIEFPKSEGASARQARIAIKG